MARPQPCCVQLLFVFAVLLLLASKTDGRGFVGFTGDYCATRPPASQCCTSRDDECTARIRVPTGRVRRRFDEAGRRQLPDELEMMDHLCYCDSFCRRDGPGSGPDGGNDCCPDYAAVCEDGAVPQPHTFQKQSNGDGAYSAASGSFASFSASEEECFENGIAYGYGQAIRRNCQNCTCLGNHWQCDSAVCLIQESLIRRVREERHTWTARNYSLFWGRTLDDGIRYRLGTLFPEKSVENMNEILVKRRELPRFFDARQRWPALDVAPRDQGDCASSWAFSTTQVAADRLSILANGGVGPRVDLSAQQLVDCNANRQRGCQGGFLDRAWWYIRKLGIVSNDCYPYTSGDTRSPDTCRISRQSLYATPPSPACVGGSWANNTVFKMTPPYRISIREEDIRAEIFTNGPVQATFLVYEDFFMYGGGVYRRVSTRPSASGYHSVKILGWGNERTADGGVLKYWICANSWGADWGERGYFRIVRGENHCEIESFVIGAWGKRLSEIATGTPGSFPAPAASIRRPAEVTTRATLDPSTTRRNDNFWHYTQRPTSTSSTTRTTSTTTTTTMMTTTLMPTTTYITTSWETTTAEPIVEAEIDTTITTMETTATTIEDDVATTTQMTTITAIDDLEPTESSTVTEETNETSETPITEGVDYLDEDKTTTEEMTTTTTTESSMETTGTTDSDGPDYINEKDNTDSQATLRDKSSEQETSPAILPTDSGSTVSPSYDQAGGSWDDGSNDGELEVPPGGVTEFVDSTTPTEPPPVDIGTASTIHEDATDVDEETTTTTSPSTTDSENEKIDVDDHNDSLIDLNTSTITTTTAHSETSTDDVDLTTNSTDITSISGQDAKQLQTPVPSRILRRLRRRKRKRRQKGVENKRKGRRYRAWRKRRPFRREREKRRDRLLKQQNQAENDKR